MLHHVKRLARKKSVIGAFSLIAVSGTAYGLQAKPAAEPVRYVLAAAERGSVIVAVNGSGQVAGLQTADVKPTVSGTITKVLVQPGEEVAEGTPLFEIDRRDALKAVRDAAQGVKDAQLSVQSSELSLQKLKQPADANAVMRAEHALAAAERALADLQKGPDDADLRQAEADLEAQRDNAKISADGTTPQVVRDAYDNAIPTLKTTVQTLQSALDAADGVIGVERSGLNDAYERFLSILSPISLSRARLSFPTAKTNVLALKAKTDALAAGSPATEVESALAAADAVVAQVGAVLDDTRDAVAATVPSAEYGQSSLDSLLSGIQSQRSSVASRTGNIISMRQSFDQAKDSFENAKRGVERAELAIEKLKKGPDASAVASAQERLLEAKAALEDAKRPTDAIDIAVSENSLAQRRAALDTARNRLADAQETMNDYTVRAPFAGVVARVASKPADQASPSTAMASLFTKAKVATITLNEVDVARVKNGQKATVTFDAIQDLSIAGTVLDVDPIGTASQGVVSYTVKVAFQGDDERIKQGMSATAAIVTDARTDVVTIPNSAVQRQGDVATVRTLASATGDDALSSQGVTSPTAPETRSVTLGLSNDQSVEVLSGLAAGDRVVTRTIDLAATVASANTGGSGALRIGGSTGLGGGGFGGGAVRIGR